jgi:uncharacterized protein YdgA (DUF945 family)
MKKATKALLIAVVAVPVAYSAAAWLIGMNVQAQLESREQELLSNAPYLELTHHEYHRGIYGATEQSTYGVRLPFPGVGALASPLGGSALQLTIRNNIHHGPLPGFRSIGLASIDTELLPPRELAQALNSVFRGQPAVSIRTMMGWRGGTTTQFASPAFHVQLPTGGMLLSSRGIQGSVATTRNRSSWSAHIVSGGFGFEGPRGRTDLGEIGFDATMRRAFEVIYVGDSDLKLARAEFQTSNGAPVELRGLSVRGTSKADSDYVDIGADAAADALKTEKLSFSRLVYGLHLSHLDGNSLASLTQAVRQARASSASGAAAPHAAALGDAFNRYGVELLVHDPVLEISQLGFAMPEGEFHLSAKVIARGITREDLSGPGGFMAVLPHLDAMLDARMDRALLEKLIATSSQAEQHSAQISRLEQQGLLKREGGAWSLRLGYHAGKLTVNGQPYPPAPAPPS